MASSTWQRVRRNASRLSTEAVRQMESLPWFTSLPASDRAAVGLVLQAGIGSFTDWLRDPTDAPTMAPTVFAAAPRELARAITLKQTVQLIRVAVGVLETHVPDLAEPGHEPELREAVLLYSRELAFGAAEVYAAAAEARGAWDARLEASVVEALVRDQVGDLTLTRAASLGWGQPSWVLTLAAASLEGPLEPQLDVLRAHARHSGLMVLTGEAGGALVVIVGGRGKPTAAVRQLSSVLPAGPVVVGPQVEDLAVAGSSVQEAMSGLAAVPAWPGAPRPVPSSALLAERALLGDGVAQSRLLNEVYRPLEEAGGDLMTTAAALLEAGGSIEGAARLLFVHANTVRYRVKKITDLVGLDVLQTRDAEVARSALVIGRTQSL